jgi:hypothetical protein
MATVDDHCPPTKPKRPRSLADVPQAVRYSSLVSPYLTMVKGNTKNGTRRIPVTNAIILLIVAFLFCAHVYKIYSRTRLPEQSEIPVDIGYLINGPSIFLEAALSLDQIVDKVTAHEYEVMYGEHLMPYYYKHPEMKMLEIGLGCTMKYGADGSVKLWKKLFPRMDLWEAEYNTICVEQTEIPPWLHVLIGDQSDPETLDRWIEESGGNFDVIVDDGGHTNCQIMTSFEKLWPHVKPGGLYFIEDLQMTQLEEKQQSTKTCNGKHLVSDKLKAIMETLVYQPMIRNDRKVARNDVETLFCQNEACVLRKRKTTTIAVNT